MIFTGAFGTVHKGELVMADGSVKAVAIKILNCKSSIAFGDVLNVITHDQQCYGNLKFVIYV